MKMNDLILMPLIALALLIVSKVIPLNTVTVLLFMTVASVYQLVDFRRRLTADFKKQEKSFKTQLEGTAKDFQLIESQLETVFRNIPSPLALMDTYGLLNLMNSSFNRFLSIPSSEALNYRSEIIDPQIRQFLKESYLTEKAIVRSVSFKGIDFQCLSIPIHENNRYAGCLLIFQDITQAVEKERLQKRFIADASHELRTPIAAIKGMIEILNRPDFDDSEIMNDFHIQIEKEAKRLETIVMDMLQLSRMSSSQTLIQPTKFDFNELVRNTVYEIRAGVSAMIDIQVHGEILHDVQMDEDKMHQVLSNLLKNACIHSGANLIQIQLKENDSDIEVRVKDNGCGISEKDLEHIFERFYRVDTHRSRSSGGSGLGLSIVKSIVNAHGGDIKVYSEVGSGTEFVMNFKIN